MPHYQINNAVDHVTLVHVYTSIVVDLRFGGSVVMKLLLLASLDLSMMFASAACDDVLLKLYETSLKT